MGTTNSRMGHLKSIMERINRRLSSVYSFLWCKASIFVSYDRFQP
jgi:hypothetical protein